MPGLARSSQPLTPLGLPLRTASTTTESVAMPLYWSLSQLSETLPAFTRRVTSGASDSSTTSAASPPSTARLWSPDAPYDSLMVTPAPAGVFWKAGMSSLNASRGVEYATRVSSAAPPAAVAAPAAVGAAAEEVVGAAALPVDAGAAGLQPATRTASTAGNAKRGRMSLTSQSPDFHFVHRVSGEAAR